MTQMTLIYTDYGYNFKKISDNPCHLCHPRSISGYVELTLFCGYLRSILSAGLVNQHIAILKHQRIINFERWFQ